MIEGLGPKSSAWLATLGIHSLDDVRRVGVAETYRQAKRAFPRQVSWNLLYGLHAAVDGVRWNDYPEAVRARMRAEVGDPPTPG